MQDRDEPPFAKGQELRGFLFLSVVMAPILAGIVVAGYGFVVWVVQLIAGPPDFTRQSVRAQTMHGTYLASREKTCIDCHKGIAHRLPYFPPGEAPTATPGQVIPVADSRPPGAARGAASAPR